MTNCLAEPDLLQRMERLRTASDGCLLFEEYYDLYYLTGLKLSKGMLLITAYAAALFVDGRYFEEAKSKCPWEVHELSDEKVLEWLQTHKVLKVGFDPLKTNYERYLFLRKKFKVIQVSLKAIKNPLIKIRAIKTQKEVAALERSAALLMKGFHYVQSLLKEGITEKEVATAFEIYCLQQGAQRMAFPPIVAFGSHSAMPHYRCGDEELKSNTLVLFDIGVVVDDYASDMTRVVLFGEVDPKLRQIYHSVKEIYHKILQRVKAGVSVNALDAYFRKMVEHEYPVLHSLGHGVGLEVHEYPRLSIHTPKNVKLQAGMVITIEPGIYLPGVGGVRYEDMILVLDTGFKNFYNNC